MTLTERQQQQIKDYYNSPEYKAKRKRQQKINRANFLERKYGRL